MIIPEHPAASQRTARQQLDELNSRFDLLIKEESQLYLSLREGLKSKTLSKTETAVITSDIKKCQEEMSALRESRLKLIGQMTKVTNNT